MADARGHGAPGAVGANAVHAWDVVITCGGTGGHVLPAVSLADALCDQGLDRKRIGFIGGTSGQETTAVPGADLDFVGLDVRGLARGRGFGEARANAAALWQLWRARARARRLIDGAGARVICGMGGYASLPAVLAARGRRRSSYSVLLYESNSVPGIATRVGARGAAYVGTAFDHTVSLLPNARRIGFIVRSELENFDRGAERERGRRAYGLGAGRRVLVVMGGSQGARSLNDATLELVAARRERRDLAVVHLVGKRDYSELRAAAESRLGAGSALGGAVAWTANDTIQYVPIDFEKHMEHVFGVADLVIARSGAATCAELAVTGTPAVCVPYPYATDDHQRHNADELARAGAAEVLADDEVSAATLGRIADETLDDRSRLRALHTASAALGGRNARLALAEDIIGVLDRHRKAQR